MAEVRVGGASIAWRSRNAVRNLWSTTATSAMPRDRRRWPFTQSESGIAADGARNWAHFYRGADGRTRNSLKKVGAPCRTRTCGLLVRSLTPGCYLVGSSVL